MADRLVVAKLAMARSRPAVAETVTAVVAGEFERVNLAYGFHLRARSEGHGAERSMGAAVRAADVGELEVTERCAYALADGALEPRRWIKPAVERPRPLPRARPRRWTPTAGSWLAVAIAETSVIGHA